MSRGDQERPRRSLLDRALADSPEARSFLAWCVRRIERGAGPPTPADVIAAGQLDGCIAFALAVVLVNVDAGPNVH